MRDQVWLISEVPGSPAPSSPQQPPQQGAGSSGSFSPQRARAVTPASPRGAGWEKAALFVQLRKTIPPQKKKKGNERTLKHVAARSTPVSRRAGRSAGSPSAPPTGGSAEPSRPPPAAAPPGSLPPAPGTGRRGGRGGRGGLGSSMAVRRRRGGAAALREAPGRARLRRGGARPGRPRLRAGRAGPRVPPGGRPRSWVWAGGGRGFAEAASLCLLGTNRC